MELERFRAGLRAFGIERWCQYDTSVVRGLAYYTGIVYEIWDAAGRLRAVAGGGRYDNLLEVLGGPKVSATGFGMGDPVLAILLEEKVGLPDLSAGLEAFVVEAAEGLRDRTLGAVGRLRRQGVAADYCLKPMPLGKAMKEANRRRARYVVIVLPKANQVQVKDFQTGDAADTTMEELLANPRTYLKPPR